MNNYIIFWNSLKWSDFSPEQKYILSLEPGCEPKPKPKTKIKSEFNSINFSKEINKRLKFLTFSKIFIIFFSHFFRFKNLWVWRILNVCWFIYQNLYNYILNYFWAWVWVHTRDSDPIYTSFWVKCLEVVKNVWNKNLNISFWKNLQETSKSSFSQEPSIIRN